MHRIARGLMALAFGAVVAASTAFAQQVSIAIATGGPGGVYYPLGIGMADVLSKHLTGAAAVARVTGGSIDNLKLVGTRQCDVAFSMVDAAVDAVRGQGKFRSGKVAARTLMVLYPNRMHVVTIAGNGIETMADLTGKRVSIGPSGSATELMALRVIEAVGLDKDKSMRRQRLEVSESVKALKGGRLDAFFWVGGLPTAAVAELAVTPDLKIKLIDQADAVEAMNRKYGGIYSAGVIPAKTYPGQDKDNAIAIVQNILVADASLPDATAYSIVKALIERRDQLIAVHDEARSISVVNQSARNSPIPWHPGAAKYFKEKGAAM